MTLKGQRQVNWTEAEKDLLRESYGKETAGEIGARVRGRDRRAVILMARRLGLNRSFDEIRNLPRYKWYRVDERYFARIRPEASYWAGFLAADGCIHPTVNSVSLSLSEADVLHVEAFRSAVCYSG